MNPFDYVKSINEKKVVSEMAGYNPFLSNHSFSNNLDCVLLANEMNTFPNLPPVCQYDFLYGTIRKGKRWGKWFKKEEHPNLQIIMDYYKYSKDKALEALQVLTQENIRDIKIAMERGGK